MLLICSVLDSDVATYGPAIATEVGRRVWLNFFCKNCCGGGSWAPSVVAGSHHCLVGGGSGAVGGLGVAVETAEDVVDADVGDYHGGKG